MCIEHNFLRYTMYIEFRCTVCIDPMFPARYGAFYGGGVVGVLIPFLFRDGGEGRDAGGRRIHQTGRIRVRLGGQNGH